MRLFVPFLLQKHREIGPVTMKCENDVSDVAHQQFVDALKGCSDVVSLFCYRLYNLWCTIMNFSSSL